MNTGTVGGAAKAVSDNQLSANFTRKEFACKCGCGLGLKDGDINLELVAVIQGVRDTFKKPVIINSGLRCADHNKRVGGAPKSQHLLGTAADIRVQGVDPAEVYRYLSAKYPKKFGVGSYNTFTHIDVRPNRARW